MKRIFTQFFGILVGCLLVNTGFAQLSATESSDANELIDLFLNDNGNLTYSNATLIGAEGASGTYVNADFGESQGVILSTGVVTDAAGPNNTIATTTVNGTPGDEDLESLADKSTNDAVSLAADFVAEGNTISFSYLFASEDYNAYVCSPFSDVMAVFINGGEYDNQNIALVPGTDLLVTSNTINDGNAGGVWSEEGCPEGGLDNSPLYVDNTDGLNYEYNGRTVVLSAEITVTPGETYSIRWVIADGSDALFDSALLLEAGSLSSSESECTAVGGELTVDGPTTVCKSDGIDDTFTLQVEGAEGENQVFVATFVNGEIILISEDPEFNLEGIPGNGTCLFWSLSWDGEIEGAEVGLNANDLMGDCFELSNPVPVTEYFTNGGEISTDDETTICVGDGIADPINVTLEGETGQNMAWVITDADLNILDLPAGPPFDLDGAGVGVCLIWHLSWSGELNGAAVGANAGDLSGDCFDLSNPIEVTREECDSCTAVGGELTVDGPTTVCKSDGIDDTFTLQVEGAEGENQVFVATFVNGEIILISEDPEFNLEGIPGNGTCLFWSLSWDGEIEGAEVGLNANDLMGDCFELSNPVPVTEYFTNGGEISTNDPTTICALDGVADPINVTLEGEVGQNMAWVITDGDLNILDLPLGPPFDLEGAGEGLCIIWHLSWSGELEGAAVGANAGDLSGDCFDLSNPIEVTRYVANGGEISTEDPTTICVGDGIGDPINVTLEGETGQNMAWVITDADLNILDLPEGPPFDLDGAGVGVCLIWHLSWSGELEGAAVGANAGDLSGDCFDLSNPIEVTREECDTCTAVGGELTVDGPTTVCKSDGIDDTFTLQVEGAEGENQVFVVTWLDGEIILISEDPEFNLEGIPGNGTCLFWSLSWDGEIEGAEVGLNANDLSGDCFELSNPVPVTEYFTNGGEISTDDETTICVGDGIGDPINVTLEGETGQNMAWVITDADLNILDLPAGPPFDLDGAGVGVCLIWHLSWSGELNGAAVGANAGDLSGDCFDLSNPIEVTREECDTCTAVGGELTVDGPTTVCKSDGIDDTFTLQVEGADGENQVFVVTWLDGEIILISEDPEFNLEGIPGNGTCLFWSLSWDGEIEGAEVGLNANDLMGDCFELSNPVPVTEYFTNGGEISTDDETTICVGDGIGDPIDVTLEGETGQNMAWVITDADLNILDLPAGPPFDLDGAGVGVCLIWHLSWSGELNGAAVGANAGDLSGDCFDLSNPIEVNRIDCTGANASNYELQTGWQPLFSVAPNPTTGFSQITFETNETVRTSIEVFDLSGRSIQTLFNQEALSDQTYRMEFEGEGLPNGVYLVRMTNGIETKFSKILIAR